MAISSSSSCSLVARYVTYLVVILISCSSDALQSQSHPASAQAPALGDDSKQVSTLSGVGAGAGEQPALQAQGSGLSVASLGPGATAAPAAASSSTSPKKGLASAAQPQLHVPQHVNLFERDLLRQLAQVRLVYAECLLQQLLSMNQKLGDPAPANPKDALNASAPGSAANASTSPALAALKAKLKSPQAGSKNKNIQQQLKAMQVEEPEDTAWKEYWYSIRNHIGHIIV